jgi:hypothetical protein
MGDITTADRIDDIGNSSEIDQSIQPSEKSIESEFPGIQTYVTLSPKTEMARRFHLKNGARELRENPNTINYIYK